MSTVDELLNSVMLNPVVESMVEANHNKEKTKEKRNQSSTSIVNFSLSALSSRS